jgi:hypothetical protein
VPLSDESNGTHFTVPGGHLGFIGSPAEFERMERETGYRLPVTSTVDLGGRQLRMFRLPPGQENAPIKAKVPGYNIRVVRPGAVLATEGEDEADGPDLAGH